MTTQGIGGEARLDGCSLTMAFEPGIAEEVKD
jgi:hypothetical protein